MWLSRIQLRAGFQYYPSRLPLAKFGTVSTKRFEFVCATEGQAEAWAASGCKCPHHNAKGFSFFLPKAKAAGQNIQRWWMQKPYSSTIQPGRGWLAVLQSFQNLSKLLAFSTACHWGLAPIKILMQVIGFDFADLFAVKSCECDIQCSKVTSNM